MGQRKVMIWAALVILELLMGSASVGALEGESSARTLSGGASSLQRLSHGEKLFQQGKWQEAMAEYQEAICRSEQAGDSAALALALLKQAKLLIVLNNEVEAEISLQRALGLLPGVQKDGEVWEAQARQALGTVYFNTGRLDEGIRESRKALDFWRSYGIPAMEVISLRELASGLAEGGDFSAALSTLDEAEELQSRLPPDPDSEGDLLTLRAVIHFERGDFQEALSAFYKLESLYRQQGLLRKSTAMRFLIANILYSLGRDEEALEIYSQVGNVSEQNGYDVMSQYVRLITLMELLQQRKYQEAGQLAQELMPFWEQSGDPKMEGIVRMIFALCQLGLADPEAALAQIEAGEGTLQKALAESGSADSLELVFTLLGALGAAEGPKSGQDPLQILGSLGEKLRSQLKPQEEREPSPDFTANYNLQTMKLSERMVALDPEGSQRELDRLIASLEEKGQRLTLSDLKAGFFGEYAHIYSDGVEVSRWAGHPEAAFDYAEKARSRAFLDQIGNQRIAAGTGSDPGLVRDDRRLRLRLRSLQKALRAEQEKPFEQQDPRVAAGLQKSLDQTTKEQEELSLRLRLADPSYAALLGMATVSLKELQKEVLDEHTTLVEYFVPKSTRNRDGVGPVLAWIIDRKHFAMVQLTVSPADLRERVTLFRHLIEAREPVETVSAELYQNLVAPLEPEVRNRNLVIVPHGVLHFVPFAALWDGKGSLGDAYTLSYSPSATVLKIIRERKAKATGPILAAGDPDGSLPFAAAEARAAARLFGSTPLLGRAATEGQVVARAHPSGILHLAAHAVLNPVNPLFTRIELAPDEEHDGNLEMQEVFGLDLSRTGLVVLSGCSTQLGPLSAGDEIEGLTRAFLYAGTPAVMSSLWEVDDESTALFMERFYSHVHKGRGRAESLRRAQVETRRKFPHPYHWAAFVLTGDGRK